MNIRLVNAGMVSALEVRFDLGECKPSGLKATLSIEWGLIEIVRRFGIAAFAKNQNGPRFNFGRKFDNAYVGITKYSVAALVGQVNRKSEHEPEPRWATSCRQAWFRVAERLFVVGALESVDFAPGHMPRPEVSLQIGHNLSERRCSGHTFGEILRCDIFRWKCRRVGLLVHFSMPKCEQRHADRVNCAHVIPGVQLI